jgi:hypothetical protein
MIFGRTPLENVLRQRLAVAESDLLTLHAVERVNSERLNLLAYRVSVIEDSLARVGAEGEPQGGPK